MKHYLILSAFLMASGIMTGQETYTNANLMQKDLNGTARYVGMGGAMGALGADLSTIATNPAGIAMFRHSAANLSFGLVSQSDAHSFANGDVTNMSFDQAGFVYSMRSGKKSFVNFAFNYSKSRNFNHILSAASGLSNASQNKLSYVKGAEGVFGLKQTSNGEIIGDGNAFNQADYLYYNVFMQQLDNDGNVMTDDNGSPLFFYDDATAYNFNRAQKGYIGQYDLNLSTNINNRVYLGLSVGIYDVHYKDYSEYTESVASGGSVTMADERRISGTGFDVKAGIIFRPIETSPFRIGLSVTSPTWYDLSTENYTVLYNDTPNGIYDEGSIGESYDFKLFTPWKFGVSLGTTVGTSLALGAEYEYADYGSSDTRVNTGGGYDRYYDEYYESSTSDDAMNDHTGYTLKGVSTLKLGMEYKPMPELALRLGYNYVSPMYNSDGFKDGSIDSPGSYYASTTDYTNWKSINRITCGVGYSYKKFTADLAYQYSCQKGDFYPFMSYYAPADQPALDNICNAVEVNNNRHQLLVTLGYHF